REHPEVRNLFTTIAGGSRQEPNRANIYVQITGKEERSFPQSQVVTAVREDLLATIREAEELVVSPIGWVSGEGDPFGSKELTYGLQGPDLNRLIAQSEALMAKMRADPAFVDVGSSFESGKPEVRITVNRDVAADLGVPASTIGRTIRTLLAGEELGSFEDRGERYEVRVQVLPEYRDTPSKLDTISVRSVSGELVPITNVARVSVGEGPVSINRENRSRHVMIGANKAPGAALSEMTAKLDDWAVELGLEDTLVPSGRTRSMQESMLALAFAFVLALLAIYMVLASLFNSLIHPFTIMMSAPLSFIGAFLALKITGVAVDMMTGIGLLVLMGLVMKNGILLIDFINQLRERGMDRLDAILQAGPQRLRPVLMTAASLILGLVPVAFSQSSGSEFRAGIAILTIGGMATSTVLTLLVVPVIYDLVDRVIEATKRGFRRLRGLLMGRRDAPATPPRPADL
ncbi:MAG: efflux RND transporter permease subunit, partial [Thermoanaerobaculia bacterium]|nr:efflux RND transporter permease subunit [Thermoanaerobaculia bacterium]